MRTFIKMVGLSSFDHYVFLECGNYYDLYDLKKIVEEQEQEEIEEPKCPKCNTSMSVVDIFDKVAGYIKRNEKEKHPKDEISLFLSDQFDDELINEVHYKRITGNSIINSFKMFEKMAKMYSLMPPIQIPENNSPIYMPYIPPDETMGGNYSPIYIPPDQTMNNE